jgi:hypothetical protein
VALIVLTSANGSPGVTSTALALAMSWPRPVVLIDADPTGANAIPAGYLRGADLGTDATILDLALAHRRGTLADDLPTALMRIRGTTVDFLPGTLTHAQAAGLTTLWEPLAGVLRALERNGQDVIVDAGRLGLNGFAMPLLLGADQALLTTRSTLPAIVAAKSWTDTLRDQFAPTSATRGPNPVSAFGVLVIGPGTPYSLRDVSKVLQAPVVASLAWDPDNARVFSVGAKPPGTLRELRRNRKASRQDVATGDQAPPAPRPGDLTRSITAATQAIQARLQASRAYLGLPLTQTGAGHV